MVGRSVAAFSTSLSEFDFKGVSMAEKIQKISIDGKEYLADALSDQAKAKLANIQFVDAEMLRTRNQLIMLQAARVEFVRQLQSELPSDSAAMSEPEQQG
jgi:hypothetical protein